MEGGGGGGGGVGEGDGEQSNGQRRGRWLTTEGDFEKMQVFTEDNVAPRKMDGSGSEWDTKVFFLSVACTLILLNVLRFWVWTLYGPLCIFTLLPSCNKMKWRNLETVLFRQHNLSTCTQFQESLQLHPACFHIWACDLFEFLHTSEV